MAVHVAPQRRDAVDVFAAVQVDEDTAACCADDQRLLGDMLVHGREGMPDVVAVPLFELTAVEHADRFAACGLALAAGKQ